jgi:hypothetical protein
MSGVFHNRRALTDIDDAENGHAKHSWISDGWIYFRTPDIDRTSTGHVPRERAPDIPDTTL